MSYEDKRKRVLQQDELGMALSSKKAALGIIEHEPRGYISKQTDNAEDPLHFKLLCPQSLIGVIVGKGATMIHLNSATGAKVSLSQNGEFFPDTTDRVIMLTGDRECMAAALRELVTRISEVADKRSCGSFLIRLLIPRNAAGVLIGKGGAIIKQMTENSQCNMQLGDEADPHNTQERIFVLTAASTHSLTLGALEVMTTLHSQPKFRVYANITTMYSERSVTGTCAPPPPPGAPPGRKPPPPLPDRGPPQGGIISGGSSQAPAPPHRAAGGPQPPHAQHALPVGHTSRVSGGMGVVQPPPPQQVPQASAPPPTGRRGPGTAYPPQPPPLPNTAQDPQHSSMSDGKSYCGQPGHTFISPVPPAGPPVTLSEMQPGIRGPSQLQPAQHVQLQQQPPPPPQRVVVVPRPPIPRIMGITPAGNASQPPPPPPPQQFPQQPPQPDMHRAISAAAPPQPPPQPTMTKKPLATMKTSPGGAMQMDLMITTSSMQVPMYGIAAVPRPPPPQPVQGAPFPHDLGNKGISPQLVTAMGAGVGAAPVPVTGTVDGFRPYSADPYGVGQHCAGPLPSSQFQRSLVHDKNVTQYAPTCAPMPSFNASQQQPQYQRMPPQHFY